MRHPKFHHLEPADNVIFDAYWTRLSSQFRGVSPLSTAINTVQDIHEAFEFNLIKAKMHALFGVAVMRDAVGTDGDLGGAAGATAETEDATATAAGDSFDLNPRSINIVDLNPGEKIELLESRTPSGEFVEGSYLFIQIGMLALDIPITCFDSRRSSFSARIADLNEYEVSSDYKRTKNRYVRQSYSDWVLQTIWNDESSTWPLRRVAEANKMRLRDVQEAVEWIPSGSPWLDKYKQVQGDQLSIDIGLDNSIDAARRRGQDVFDNIDKQAQVIEYARLKGVPLLMGKSGARSIEEIVQDEVAKSDENAADEKGEENE
jgi:capsid protein